MSLKLLKLRRDHAATKAKLQHMIDVAEEEGRALTAEEDRSFADWSDELESLSKKIRTFKPEEEGNQRQQPRTKRASDPAHIGLSRQDMRRYSIVRAINASLAARRGDSKAWVGAELEYEASEAVNARVKDEPRGFYVPSDILETRDLNTGTATAGGNLVATDLLASSFIELLRNRLVVRQAGATMLTGLVGNVDIPKQTGGATAYWVGQGGSPTESEQTIGQVSLIPHTVGAFTDFTRQLLKQSSLDIEMFVRSDLVSVLGLAIDYAALHGDSSADVNQPDGITSITGVGSVAGGTNGAAPTWGNIIGLETEVAADNADVGSLAYVTNALVRGKLKQTEKAASTAQFVWGGNEMNGYRTLVSNQVRSDLTKGSGTDLSAILFGNWRDLLIGMWGGLDIMVDPYTHSTSGTTRVVALQSVDIAVRHPQSFSVMLDAVTT